MTHDECLELVERVLGDRLRVIFDTRTVGCDASLAAVIASALAVDLRLVAPENDPAKKLAGMTDGEISDLGGHLAATLDGLVVNPHHLPELEFELPFGTVAQVYLDDLSIGKESWITEHGRPGLVPYASVGSEISGPNLKMLQSRIRKLVSKHPCKAIGLPSEFRRTGLYEDRGCLRFPPFAEAGGAVLLCQLPWAPLPFRSAPRADVGALAKTLAFTMRRLWAYRASFAETADGAREIGDRIAASIGTTVSAIVIDSGPTLHRWRKRPTIIRTYIAYDGLDDALRPGLALELIDDPRLYRGGELVLHRRRRLHELRELGANGRITALSRWVIKASPRGAASELARLNEGRNIVIEIPLKTCSLIARLWWSDGVIEAEVKMPRFLTWRGTTVRLMRLGIPQTLLTAAIGLRIDQVVELPFPCPARIKSAKEFHGPIFEIGQGPTWLVDTESGRMWSGGAAARRFDRDQTKMRQKMTGATPATF